MFPLDQIAYVGVRPSINLKLTRREVIFEVTGIRTYVITVGAYLNVTDGRTDDILWHNRALRNIAR